MKLLSFSFTQLFPFTELIRGDKNDLIPLAVLLFLVAVYAHHQQNQQTLLACCVCWPQCMIAVRRARPVLLGSKCHPH